MRTFVARCVVAVVTACSTAPVPSPEPTASESVEVTFSPSPSPSRTIESPVVTASPTRAPAPSPITDLAQVFRPLTVGWRPSGPTLLLSASVGDRSVLTALPFSASGPTSAPIPLVNYTGQLSIRADGQAVAVSVGTDRGIRIAVYDVRTSKSAWVTPPASNAGPPAWSKDGAFLYYATALPTADFKGSIHRVDAQGANDIEVATLDRFGDVSGVTIDGRGLIWSRGQAGGSVDILDLATGANRQLQNNASIVSMRVRQPRALLIVGACCAGPGGGSLQIWDDERLTSREVGSRTSDGFAYASAAWDPSGTRVAAARLEGVLTTTASLVILDPDTGAAQSIPDTTDARQVVGWPPEGIVFAAFGRRSPTIEVKLLPAGGAPAVPLYSGSGYVFPVIIRP